MEKPPFDFAAAGYPLAPNTLYRVGGPAAWALLPRVVEEAEAAYTWMAGQPGPKFILGAGSNVLITDDGFPGIVLITTGLDRLEALGENRYHAACGVGLDRLVREAMLEKNYEGVGALAGIPGSVGGAIYMNAGTVNGSTCQFLESVEVMKPTGRRSITPAPDMYGYRSQTFCGEGDLVLEAVFRFRVAREDQRAVYHHYIRQRLEKQPQGYCCGSVFKNPPGHHAGELIEACGLKGARRGGAIISPKHANFIMNEQNASFDDIIGLLEFAKEKVRGQFGVELEEEVRIVR